MPILRSMTNDDLLAYRHLCSICYTYTDTNPVDEKTPDGASEALEEQIKKKEGERILKGILPNPSLYGGALRASLKYTLNFFYNIKIKHPPRRLKSSP